MDFLSIENLKTGYFKNTIIEDLSFSVKKGESVGIIGPNGAGKTTLLKSLSHIIRPTSGKVLLDGVDIHAMDNTSFARRCSLVGQDIKSVFSFTVFEIVMMGRTPYIGMLGSESKEDIAICDEILTHTKLKDLKDKPIDELSAGERQRTLIARALAQEPDLLLLDEPTAHLDIGYQVDILDLIRGLKEKKNLTLVCVLHDLNLASQYCDKLLLIDKGNLIGFDTPSNILKYDILEKTFNATCVVDDKIIPGKPIVIPFTKKL